MTYAAIAAATARVGLFGRFVGARGSGVAVATRFVEVARSARRVGDERSRSRLARAIPNTRVGGAIRRSRSRRGLRGLRHRRSALRARATECSCGARDFSAMRRNGDARRAESGAEDECATHVVRTRRKRRGLRGRRRGVRGKRISVSGVATGACGRRRGVLGVATSARVGLTKASCGLSMGAEDRKVSSDETTKPQDDLEEAPRIRRVRSVL